MNMAGQSFIRAAAVCTPVEIGNPKANAAAILSAARPLASGDVAISVFPELCLSGYTAEDLFFNDSLLEGCRAALEDLVRTNPLPVMVVGTPWRLADGRLLNCAAVIANGALKGLVPKTVHPNYGEFYDQRWFVSGRQINERIVDETFGTVACRTDQLFDLGGVRFGIEICEDAWAPVSPATSASLAGAVIILNLSASNELIAKADYRRDLVRMASARNICAYVYASAGPTESTKDVVFGGHNMIYENGHLLAEGERFAFDGSTVQADIDIAALIHDRTQNTSFAQTPRPPAYRITSCGESLPTLTNLQRSFTRHPFVPDDENEIGARAREILSIQATGLTRRMKAARAEKLVIGLSGGLDSTLAFLVCLDALDRADLDFGHLEAITMPGPGTSDLTLSNTRTLAESVGVTLTEIPIGDAVEQHLDDLDHDGSHDVVFENAQARERTQILFNYANKVNGLVVGTGDLSELALGWCTFNADQMASYNVNASVPKTMIAYLVRWYGRFRANDQLNSVLASVLDTPISPELLPPEEGAISQHTEDIVGPYELHDFFLFHFLRYGASPARIFNLARASFSGTYDEQAIKKWLRVFFSRFLTQQFKRTTLPPGPKVGTVSLSPRGDWRMPDETSVDHLLASIDNL